MKFGEYQFSKVTTYYRPIVTFTRSKLLGFSGIHSVRAYERTRGGEGWLHVCTVNANVFLSLLIFLNDHTLTFSFNSSFAVLQYRQFYLNFKHFSACIFIPFLHLFFVGYFTKILNALRTFLKCKSNKTKP